MRAKHFFSACSMVGACGLFLFAFRATLVAQELAPAIAPIASKRAASLNALEAEKSAALERARQPYLAALDAAEKTATAKGELETVAAISRERTALMNGLVPPAPPEGLPKGLHAARKSTLDALSRAATEDATRRRAVDVEYLRALTTLQTQTRGNPELAAQITAEKQKLLAAVTGSSGATASGTGGKSSGRNAIINGAFDQADATGLPAGWTLPSKDASAFKVIRDGNNAVLRITVEGRTPHFHAHQEVAVPSKAKSATVRARMRGKWTDRRTDDDNWGLQTSVRFVDADGKPFGPWTILVGGMEPGWKAFTKTMSVPAGAKAVRVQVGVASVAGVFDFDEVELEFR